MRYLASFLLLFILGHGASSQEPLDSVYSEAELEDSISSFSIRPVKHLKRLLKKLMMQIELDALKQVKDDRMYQFEATYTLDGFPPFTASCILPAKIDSIPRSIFITNSFDAFLKNVRLKGPYNMTSEDTIRLKRILYDAVDKFCHPYNREKDFNFEVNWPFMFAPHLSYRQIVRFCNVTAYSIDDASGRSVFRIHLTKKSRLRPGASIGNWILPGYKVDAYFDSKTLQMTQLKFGSRGPSLRWKTTQNLQQYDYDIIDGKPILVRHKKIGIFDGKIKERDNLYIINQ